MEFIIIFILWICIWIMFGFFIWKIIKYKILKEERKNSIKKSKSVIMGELYEKILPFLPNFQYKPKDMTFVWKWIDYIIFDGLNEWNLKEIIFLEVKSGASQLNKNEKMIREAIQTGKIKYIEYRI